MAEKGVMSKGVMDNIGGLNYNVTWFTYPDDAKDLRFCRSWFEQILPELQMLLKAFVQDDSAWFALQIGEMHLDKNAYEYHLEVTAPPSDEDAPIYSAGLSLQQYYFARCTDHRSLNYAGRIEVNLGLLHHSVMTTEEEQAQLQRMARMVFMTYYEKIVELYPNYETDYVDAPAKPL